MQADHGSIPLGAVHSPVQMCGSMPQLTDTAPAMSLTIIVKVPVIYVLLHDSSVVWHLASIACSKAVISEVTSLAAGASPGASSDCMPSSKASKHARSSPRHHKQAELHESAQDELSCLRASPC